MTDMLDEAVRSARDLPPEKQDEVARLIMSLVGRDDIVDLTAEEEAAVLASRAAAARGEFATDEQMRAIRAKYLT